MHKVNEVDKVEQFLKAQGWPVTRIAPGVLRSSFRGATTTLPLVVQFEAEFAKLTVLPIARIPADPQKAEALYDRLLRLNGTIRLARYSLDEDGDVLLSVEFPAIDLDASELRDALDVLTFYAEAHLGEIRQLVS